MFGGEIPDLETTPCQRCGEPVAEGDAVWDAWHQGERRFAALPYHRACADEILPPPTPSEEHRRCPLCEQAIDAVVLAAAFAQLHDRFRAATPSLRTPDVVWRLDRRQPSRVYVAEHFTCVLTRATRRTDADGLPGLPPERGE